jgi:hypothetical protein
MGGPAQGSPFPGKVGKAGEVRDGPDSLKRDARPGLAVFTKESLATAVLFVCLLSGPNKPMLRRRRNGAKSHTAAGLISDWRCRLGGSSDAPGNERLGALYRCGMKASRRF